MRWNQLLFGLLLCSSFFSFGQQSLYYNQRPEFLKANSVWAFGRGAGLDFNSGSPVPVSTKIEAHEGCASVADPVTGKLLFYSDGGLVYNANHQIMPNGDSLLGNVDWESRTGKKTGLRADFRAASSVQGVCIVPVIGDPDKYYLFSLSGITSGGLKVYDSTANGQQFSASLFYNIIDMSLDNGLGDIVPGKKNIPLFDEELSEAMIAIPGDNCDVWLVVHPIWGEEFRAFHITHEGIDTIPVVSYTGNLAGQTWGGYTLSSMAVSPDRQKIAIGNSHVFYSGLVEIGQFNPGTGEINIEMSIHQGGSYGICFSPDGSKLYINELGYGISQFDLSVYNATAITNSKYSLGRYLGLSLDDLSGLRLYDDKIYLSKGSTKFLGRINQPNLAGAACDFQADVIQLIESDTAQSSLNNDVILPLPPDTTEVLALDTMVCRAFMTLEAPKDFNAYQWDDGSTSASREVTESGIYWVVSKDFCYPRIDTFIVKTFDFPHPVINVNVLELGVAGNFNYSSYQWLLNNQAIQGATGRTYTVSENGNYQVIVTNGQGCIDTSDIYRVTNAEEASIGHIKEGIAISIYPNPTNDILYIQSEMNIDVHIFSIDGKAILKANSAKEVSLAQLSDGIYLMQIRNKDGNLIKVEKIIKK